MKTSYPALAPASMLSEKYSVLIICIAVVISPFLSYLHFFPNWGFHNNQRLFEIACLTAISVMAIIRPTWQQIFKGNVSHQVLISLLLFFLIGFVSAVHSFSPRHAFFEWSSFLLLTVAVATIATEMKEGRKNDFGTILTIWGSGCVLYLLVVTILYAVVISTGVQPPPDAFIFGFDNRRFFNHTQTISLSILGLLALLNKQDCKRYRFWFFVTSAWWMLVFMSAGRGTFVGVVAGVVATSIFRRRLANPWLRLMICTCIAGYLLNFLFFFLVPLGLGLEQFGLLSNVVDRSIANPASNRFTLWSLAFQMIWEHPWLGAGPLHFAHYGISAGDGAHPHNWVLQIASEWGLLALGLLIFAVGIAYRALIRTGSDIDTCDTNNQAALCAWLTIGAAILVDGLVSGLLVMPATQMSIVLYVGCAWGWVISRLSRQAILPAQERLSFRIGRPVAAVLLFALVMLWRGLFPEIIDINGFEANSLKSHHLYPTGIFKPRIWTAGYF